MSTSILLSIIMASYNSEKTIETALKSIRAQSLDSDQMEVFVIDGGSSDRTIEIAKSYGAKVLNNPERLPELAKRIGMQASTGKYLLIMDSDEQLPEPDRLEQRVCFLQQHPEAKCLLGRYQPSEKTPPCGHYMSYIGDPFSAFVYNWYIDGNIRLISQKDVLHEPKRLLGYFTEGDIIPVGDSVTMMDRLYLMEHYRNLLETENTSTLFQKLVEDTHYVAHLKNDYVIHYTKSDFQTYLKKLKFRVINNVYDVKGSGFAARQQISQRTSKKKYLYPLYCLSLVLPLFDGIRMSLYYRKWIYLAHIFFSWYVLIQIIIQYTKKMCGKTSKNQQYG